jgi:hypothetical protein
MVHPSILLGLLAITGGILSLAPPGVTVLALDLRRFLLPDEEPGGPRLGEQMQHVRLGLRFRGCALRAAGWRAERSRP